jgi:hypothetical protein
VAQGVGPEFQTQYYKKKKKMGGRSGKGMSVYVVYYREVPNNS